MSHSRQYMDLGKLNKNAQDNDVNIDLNMIYVAKENPRSRWKSDNCTVHSAQTHLTVQTGTKNWFMSDQ